MPYNGRPSRPVGHGGGDVWEKWLVSDQREVSGRPDVIVYVSDVLTTPLKISGQPIANLLASTSGTTLIGSLN